MKSIIEILKSSTFEYSVTLTAWVKTIQIHPTICFININDGTTVSNLQVIYKGKELDHTLLTTGTAIKVTGIVQKSTGKDQQHELLASSFEILAVSDASYPIQKKNISLEFLRKESHQRHRTKMLHSVAIIKKEVMFAIHQYFHKEQFFQTFPPIFTTNNCEGGSDVFELSTEGAEFFKKNTLLSVSGQFYAEALALGLKNVYILSPTFRAEKSNSSHHLAEFWMLEIEKSFCELPEMLLSIEDFLKYVTKFVLDNCKESLTALSSLIPENEDLITKLEKLLETKFQTLEYKEAITILQKAVKEEKIKFLQSEIQFGMNLNSEHERYLAEVVFNSPIFVINYPKDLKAFYMKQNDDGITVAAVDLLVPKIGELIGGSERETVVEKIIQSASDKDIPLDSLGWYLDLRKYGYHKSSGYGLGFERLIMYYTGLTNIKEVPSFPRSYQQINF